MVEATIRPVFPRPRTTTEPIIRTLISTGSGSDSVTDNLDVRPPVGEQWILNFAQITLKSMTVTAPACRAYIYYFDGTNYIIIASDDGAFKTVAEEISISSFGNGPITITNSNYVRLQFSYAGGDAGTAWNVHMIALAERM